MGGAQKTSGLDLGEQCELVVAGSKRPVVHEPPRPQRSRGRRSRCRPPWPSPCRWWSRAGRPRTPSQNAPCSAGRPGVGVVVEDRLGRSGGAGRVVDEGRVEAPGFRAADPSGSRPAVASSSSGPARRGRALVRADQQVVRTLASSSRTSSTRRTLRLAARSICDGTAVRDAVGDVLGPQDRRAGDHQGAGLEGTHHGQVPLRNPGQHHDHRVPRLDATARSARWAMRFDAAAHVGEAQPPLAALGPSARAGQGASGSRRGRPPRPGRS